MEGVANWATAGQPGDWILTGSNDRRLTTSSRRD